VSDTGVHQDAVFQHAAGAEHQPDGVFQEVYEVLFQPLVEELAGHLDGEHVIFKLYGHNGFEPGPIDGVVVGTQILFYDLKAFCPYSFIIIFHLSKMFF